MAKILYFEDNSKLRAIVIDVLRANNNSYEFDGYSDPTEFLVTIKNLSRYDLIMSDINMLNMTGIEFVKRYIVDKNLKIPVLFLSAGNDEREIRKAGVNDFKLLSKTAEIPDLERTVRELLERK